MRSTTSSPPQTKGVTPSHIGGGRPSGWPPLLCWGRSEQRRRAGRWETHVDPYNRVRPGARHHPVQQRQRRGRAIQRQAPTQHVFQHHPTVTRHHRAQDRISSRRRRRHGQPELAGSACGAADGPPRRAESLFAFWPFDFDRLAASRKATACADALGPRARELFPEPLPYGSLGKLRARTLHSRGLNAGPDLQCQTANKNGRQRPKPKGNLTMAHELDSTNGHVSFANSRTDAWHRLGQSVGHAMTGFEPVS